MSLPSLRQPKFASAMLENRKKAFSNQQYMILTLKEDKKLVVSSDGYNGIINIEETFKCVFCSMTMELDYKCKETHKNSAKHKIAMEDIPFIAEYSGNLVKKLNKDQVYCTICNVIVASPFLTRHISSEIHIQELERASVRASSYKPNV